MKLLALFAAAALVTGCAAHRPAPVSRSRLVPLVDHHQHLISPESVDPPETPLPPVALPPELERLLRKREAALGSKTPSDVFTDDAQILTIGEDRWIRGRAAVEEFVAHMHSGLSYVPNAFAIDGSTGYVAGTVRQEGAAVLNFLLALRKGADGGWRIAAESSTLKSKNHFEQPITAELLIRHLDDAGIERAVLLSTAFWHSKPGQAPGGEDHARVQRVNDWFVAQAALYPERLTPFCAVNPLAEYALDEVERCSKLPAVRGFKLHFGNSRVDVRNPEHLEKVKRFFRAANDRRLAIVVHAWLAVEGGYGKQDAELILRHVLPEAPDIVVQLAHLGGAGPGYIADDAMAVYAQAIAAGDPRTRRLYFDITTNVTDDQPEKTLSLIATRLRQVGLNRVLFGADTIIVAGHDPPVIAWATFRRRIPLSDEELATIAANVAPYLR